MRKPKYKCGPPRNLSWSCLDTTLTPSQVHIDTLSRANAMQDAAVWGGRRAQIRHCARRVSLHACSVRRSLEGDGEQASGPSTALAEGRRALRGASWEMRRGGVVVEVRG